MSEALANEFSQILPTLAQNNDLRAAIMALIGTEPVAGKATEGGDRLEKFRSILWDLANNQISLQESFIRVSRDIPRNSSPHSSNNRVFADGWEERLVRIQFSRFYNQAVMEQLIAAGETECFVPHSSSEDSTSPCSSQLAGSNQNLKALHFLLTETYGKGNFGVKGVKVPNHPHCTHVVTRAK